LERTDRKEDASLISFVFESLTGFGSAMAIIIGIA